MVLEGDGALHTAPSASAGKTMPELWRWSVKQSSEVMVRACRGCAPKNCVISAETAPPAICHRVTITAQPCPHRRVRLGGVHGSSLETPRVTRVCQEIWSHDLHAVICFHTDRHAATIARKCPADHGRKPPLGFTSRS